MLNDDSSGSDKSGPYKTTTHITNRYLPLSQINKFYFKQCYIVSAPRRPMASRQDSGSGSVGLAPAPPPPRRR